MRTRVLLAGCVVLTALLPLSPAMPSGLALRTGVAQQTGVTSPMTLAGENFDGLTSKLQYRKDETSIPSTLLGWTHSPPTGWTVWNDPVMAGLGTTEWRGWTFATPAFWQAAE